MIPVAELASYLGADREQHAALHAIEKAAVAEIERLSGRNLTAATAATDIVEYANGRGNGDLRVANPVASVTLLELRGATFVSGGWSSIDVSEIDLDGQWILARDYDFPVGVANVRVTYRTTEYVGAESEVTKQVVRDLVSWWWTNRRATISPDDGVARPGSTPRDLRRRIQQLGGLAPGF